MDSPVRMRVSLVVVITLVVLGMLAPRPQGALVAAQRATFQSGTNDLIVEVLDNSLVHFEASPQGPGLSDSIFTTPQVARTDYTGPGSFTQNRSILETPQIGVTVDTTILCATTTDKIKNLQLTTFCPPNLSQTGKGLTFTPGSMQHIYGLREQFITQGSTDSDWTGRARTIWS